MRIIMLTARGRDVEREKGLALGADDYITKPFSTKDAIARVEAVLARPEKRKGSEARPSKHVAMRSPIFRPLCRVGSQPTRAA